MKKALIFLFLISSFSMFAQEADRKMMLAVMRGAYSSAHTDSARCAKMMKKLGSVQAGETILFGYRGAVTATAANHQKAPAEKLKLFKEGRSQLEQSITKMPNSTELRFLRLTIQSNCPKALGYNKEIESDKKYVLDNYLKAEPDVKKMISSFAKQSNIFSEEEKKQLE